MRFLILLILFNCPILSALEVQFTTRSSEELKLQVQKGTTSFLVSLEFESKEALMVQSLVDPNGREYIKSNIGSSAEYRIPAPVHSSFRSLIRMTYVSKKMVSIFVSNNGLEDHIAEGIWKLKIAKQKKKPGLAKVYLNLKEVNQSNLKRPQLDLTINYDTRESSISEKAFQDSVKALVNFYSQYGIALNVETTKWIDPIPKEKDLEIKLSKLQDGKRQNLQMYLFKRNSSVKKDFQGVAGCLPFVILKVIKKHCALIVAYENQEEVNHKKMIKVMAHEIAHSLGLFHLVDDFYPFGALQDPIEDTFDAIDTENVMHKTSDFFGYMEFTKGQIEVMKRNPYLY